MSHVVDIAQRAKTIIEALLAEIQTDGATPTVSRAWLTPSVRIRKRRASHGATAENRMRFGEGITIVPMEPKRSVGTNERDGVGYRYLISIAQGTQTEDIDDSWSVPIWEQAIRQRFHNKRMGDLTLDGCEQRTVVQPGALPEWAMLEDSVDASFLVLTEYVRENRRS